jgi:hypothetical protein
MTKKPSLAQTMALKAAAAVANEPDEPNTSDKLPFLSTGTEPTTAAKKPGRPRGKRDIEARVTVYLDAARHDALVKIAADRRRSIHSLILEGIDAITGKPTMKAWE